MLMRTSPVHREPSKEHRSKRSSEWPVPRMISRGYSIYKLRVADRKRRTREHDVGVAGNDGRANVRVSNTGKVLTWDVAA